MATCLLECARGEIANETANGATTRSALTPAVTWLASRLQGRSTSRADPTAGPRTHGVQSWALIIDCRAAW